MQKNREILSAWHSFFKDFPFTEAMKKSFATELNISVLKLLSIFYLHFKKIQSGGLGYKLTQLKDRWDLVKKVYPNDNLIQRNNFQMLDKYFNSNE